MFLQQDQLVFLYTVTRISAAWLVAFVLSVVSVPSLLTGAKAWFSRNSIPAKISLIAFILLSIPITLLPTILMRYYGVRLEPGLSPTASIVTDYTTNNFTYDPLRNNFSINALSGSTKITTTATMRPVNVNAFDNLLFPQINPTFPKPYGYLHFNNTFVNTTHLVVANGTFSEDGTKNSAYGFSKELVVFGFSARIGDNEIPENGFSNNNMNINILPLAPVFETYPNGITVWATLINNNGTAILETGIVGYYNMYAASDNAGYDCKVAQRLFLPQDPELCYDNWGLYGPVIIGGGAFYKWSGNVQIGGGIMTDYVTRGWVVNPVKIVKSYFLVDVDPSKWRESTVGLALNVKSDISLNSLRRPLNITAMGDTPVTVDSTMLAHLLYLVGSPDANPVGSYALGRIISTPVLVVWGIICVLLPISLQLAVKLWFKDLELAMQPCWESIVSSATGRRGFQDKPLDVSLRTRQGGVDVLMNGSVSRTVDEDESGSYLVRLNSVKF
ncbi:hypothetical protein BGZ93_008072 [Podila epicladia]|nr:hypothetical protein BGZ93_008072 [Podila epicladia]